MDHASVRLLKDRFDLGDGEAEHILGSFVEAVERGLEEYGICHVAGIGSFVRAPGDSRISFEPADALTRAVNVRFADLPVYEIDTEEAVDRPIETTNTEVSSAQVMSVPTNEGAAISPDAEESVSSGAAESTSSGVGESEAEPAAASTEEAEDSDGSPAGPVDEPPAVPPVQADNRTGTEDTEDADPTVPSPAVSRSPRGRRKKKSGGLRAAWVVLPLLAVVAVAAIWLMQRPAGQDPESESIANQSTPAAQTPAVDDVDEDTAPTTEQAPPGEASGDGREPDDAQTTDDAREPALATADAQTTDDARAARQTPTPRETETGVSADEAVPEYALDRSVDGYTMIVGSSPDRTAADEQISRFTELDLPYGVLDYSEDGSPMYRLAVGLFDSAQQADSVRQAMAEILPSGTWVWRIR